MKLILTALILLPFLLNCNGKPDGAPLSACLTLIPVHGPEVAPSKTRSPYVVSAEPTANNKVKVTISSQDQDFQGFVLQARRKNDPSKFVNGSFTTSPGTKTIDCFKNLKGTLTQVNPTQKKAVVTEWTPDPDVNEDVIFRATVAKTKLSFWTELDSQSVSIHSGTVAAMEEGDKPSNPMYEGCFDTKGCFGLPDGCLEVTQENCKILLTYNNVPGGVRFRLHGHLDSHTYMAVGLSEDGKMGEDSVNECIRDNSDVIARESWNEGNANTRTKVLPSSDYHSKYSDGLSSCSWVKSNTFESNGMVFDLVNDNYHLLLATGVVDGESLGYHKNDRIASLENFNLTEFEHLEEENDASSKIDGIAVNSNVTDSSEKYGEVTTSAGTNYTTEQGTSHGSQLSFNTIYVILVLLLAVRAVKV